MTESTPYGTGCNHPGANLALFDKDQITGSNKNFNLPLIPNSLVEFDCRQSLIKCTSKLLASVYRSARDYDS